MILSAQRAAAEVLETRTLLTATPLYWAPGASAGNWDTLSTNMPWHTGSISGPAVAWPASGDYLAVFPGGGTAVHVDGNVNVGSISFVASGYLLTGTGSLTLAESASTVSVLSGSSTVAVPISGTSGLGKTGAGTLILAADNSYTGATSVVGGTVQVGNGSNTGNLSNNSVVLYSGTVLAFDRNDLPVFGNNITLSGGSESINVLGNQTTTLTGTISGNGLTQWGGGGVVEFSGDYISNAPVDVGNGQLNVLAGASVDASSISVGADGSLDAQGSSLDDMTSLDDDGVVNLTTPQPGNIGVLVPITLSGAGTLTINGGTLNLAGADTYVGATAIHSGTLLVTNTAGSATGISTVSVGNGASLDGSGNAGGSVSVAAGGTVDPGDGMLTSVLDTGSVSFADGSNFNVTINNSTTNSLSIGYDQLKVTGNISIASLSTGATLNLSGVGNTAAGDQLIIAQCTGTLTGTFANATPGTILTVGNESYSVSYTSSEMILTDVTPAAPTLVSASAASSSEIDLAWTDNAASSVGDIICESDDGGATFYPIDEVAQAATGVSNTYQVTGLTAGSSYAFYILTDMGIDESAPSNTMSATTTFVPPTLDAEGTGTVVEGQPYELDLTAEYPDGEPGAIDHWVVNWGDGSGDASGNSYYYYQAGADPTQPLAVTHTFNAGVASPTVTVKAVDAANGSWSADDQAIAVTPLAPSGLTASASGSSINVGWTNNSSISQGSTVLLSTDNTAFFEAGSAPAAAPGTMSVTTLSDLNLDTAYWVEVLTEGANGESTATTPQLVATDYAPPTLVITPVSAPAEGQNYSLNLSATYADGTPQKDTIANWQIDWGDGHQPQSYGGDTMVASSGTYPADTTSATVNVTATDTNGHSVSWTQTIVFSPIAPGGVSARYNADGSVATVSWQRNSNIASNYLVEYQAPGSSAWITAASVPASSAETSFSVPVSGISTNLSGDAGYLFRVIADSPDATGDDPDAPGESDTVAAPVGGGPNVISGLLYDGEMNTNGEDPVQITTSPASAAGLTDGQNETITIANLPPHMAFNVFVSGGISRTGEYSDSSDTVTLSGTGITTPIEQDNPIDGIDLTADIGDLNTYSSATFVVKAHVNSSAGETWSAGAEITTMLGSVYVYPNSVDVGGSINETVTLSCAGLESVDNVKLNVVNSDQSILSAPSTVTLAWDGNGGFSGTIPVKGLKVGQSPLIVQDVIGDEGSYVISAGAPSVSAFVPGEIEGGTYNTTDDNKAGFTFNIPYPSATAVTVNFDTKGSTLPASVLSQLGTSVSVPGDTQSVFVPFSMADDGLVAPDRFVFVTLDVPGEAQGSEAHMKIANTDTPIIKINGATDHAVIKLDPQGDKDNLTTITLDANAATAAGETITSTTLSWNPAEFAMWLNKQVGAPGTDLGHGSGTYTWTGAAYPKTIYGQALSGSADWNSTRVTLSVAVVVPETQKVEAQTGGNLQNANGTINGPELIWKSKVVNGVTAGDMLIGQQAVLSVKWVGPMHFNGFDSTYNWQAPGGVGGFVRTDPPDQQGHVVPIFLNSYYGGTIEELLFYWASMGKNGGASQESVSCSGNIFGNDFGLSTTFNVYTPNWTFDFVGIGKPQAQNGVIKLLKDATHITNGAKYTASVSAAGLPSDLAITNASWFFTQLIAPDEIYNTPNGVFVQNRPSRYGLDGAFYYGFDGSDPLGMSNTPESPVDGMQHIFGDYPTEIPNLINPQGVPLGNANSFSFHDRFQLFLMFQPPGPSIPVPLAVANYRVDGQATDNGQLVANPTSDATGDPPAATSTFPDWYYAIVGGDYSKV